VLIGKPKQRQTWDNPLPGIPLGERLSHCLKYLLNQRSQHILLIEVVGVKRGTADVCLIQQVLHGDRVIAFLSQEVYHRGTDQAAGALGTTILFVLLRLHLPSFSDNPEDVYGNEHVRPIGY
jgi:hypothetical protein